MGRISYSSLMWQDVCCFVSLRHTLKARACVSLCIRSIHGCKALQPFAEVQQRLTLKSEIDNAARVH